MTTANLTAEHYRQEAQILEDIARRISLVTDREKLVSEAKSLRQRAADIVARPEWKDARLRD